MSKPPPRILAIDPGTRYMGVAVLDGPELLYYGVKTFRAKRPADELIRATRRTLFRLITDHRSTVLAYEKTFYVQSKNSALLQVQEAEIKRAGQARGLKVVGYSPAHVRRILCEDGRATKEDVADVLVRRFPELSRYRPPTEVAHQAYWLNMFDAVAVAAVGAAELSAVGTGRLAA